MAQYQPSGHFASINFRGLSFVGRSSHWVKHLVWLWLLLVVKYGSVYFCICVFVYLCICIWLVLVVKYGMHWVPCAYQLTRVWMLPQHMACVGLNSTQGSLLIQHKTAPYQQTHFLSAKMEGKSFQCQPLTSMIKYKYYTLQLRSGCSSMHIEFLVCLSRRIFSVKALHAESSQEIHPHHWVPLIIAPSCLLLCVRQPSLISCISATNINMSTIIPILHRPENINILK